MAKTIYRDELHKGYVDFDKNEARNLRTHNLASAPSSPVEGQRYYDTVTKLEYFWNGTAWVAASGAAYTDEQAQDAVGAMLTDSATIDFTYNDGANTETADVKKTLDHTWITDFDTQVRTSRLDQMAAPTAPVSLNSQKITSLLDPTAAQDAATKAYVDAAAAGIDWKASVRAATAAAGTLASSFENGDTIDGVVLATGDRILIKDQAAGAENGIYVVAASGAPARASDADVSAEVTAGLAVFVEEGTVNADTGWLITNNGAITLGTTALVFTQFTSLGQVSAGTGLSKSGSTISVDTAVVVRKFVASITGGATSEVVTHNLGTRDVTVALINNATPWDSVEVEWEATSTNTITLRSPVNLPASYRVVVHG